MSVNAATDTETGTDTETDTDTKTDKHSVNVPLIMFEVIELLGCEIVVRNNQFQLFLEWQRALTLDF